MDRKLQSWIARAESIARSIVIVMLVLGWGSLLSYEDHVERTSPRVSTSETGEVVPVSWKSVTVYVRPFDARVIRYTNYIAIPTVGLLIAFSLFRDWRRKRKIPGSKDD